MAAQNDISLVELAALLHTEHGASFGASTVWRCRDRHGMTFTRVRRAIEAAEAAEATLRYLPPYSPALNPIGNAYSKLTAILRKAAAQTIANLRDVICDTLPQFTPQDRAKPHEDVALCDVNPHACVTRSPLPDIKFGVDRKRTKCSPFTSRTTFVDANILRDYMILAV